MNIAFRSSKKGKKNKVLDLINFNNLLPDNDILLYDNDYDNTYADDYDYVISDDDFYKDDTIYYL